MGFVRFWILLGLSTGMALGCAGNDREDTVDPSSPEDGGRRHDLPLPPVTPPDDAAPDTAGDPGPPDAGGLSGFDCVAACSMRETQCGAIPGFDCARLCGATINVGNDAGCPEKAEPWARCITEMCDLTACQPLSVPFANECAAPYCVSRPSDESCQTLEG